MKAIITAVLPFCLVPGLLAQAPAPPFNIRVQQGPNVSALTDGGSFTMPADAIGLASTANIVVTYRGATNASVNSVDLTGHTDFFAGGFPELPVTVTPNQTVSIFVRYLPTTSARVQGRITIGWSEGRTNSTMTLNIVGVAPEFAFSYIPQPGGNATTIASGAAIPFPVTAVDTTSSAVIVATNRGSGSGDVKSVTLTGAAFALAGVPLLPATVEAGKELRFTVQFTPKQIVTSQGAVQVELIDRQPVFRLEGSGSGPVFAYEVVQAGGVTPLLANQAITLPDAVIGDKSSLTVRFRNTGNADGTIAANAISVQGTAFTLSDVPFLPMTMQPGAVASFTVTFTPTQPGRTSGRLRIGDGSFEVSGNGLGPTLAYSYAIGSAVTTVQNNGSVIFTPVAVGHTTSVRFTIANTGTAPTSVNSISLGGSNLPFTLAELPSLPLTLAPAATADFSIQFAPVAVGAATTTLRVDTLNFTLSGSAGPPDALPGYRFTAPSGPQEPMQQPAISLALDTPYPLTLNGALTLTFNSEVGANDPTVQFVTTGRTVNFTIPANTRNAVFPPQNASQVRIQTGTVAGTITLTPSFATDGGINLTPTTPPVLNLSVAQSAPRLLNVAMQGKTANSFTLVVSGYATGRTVTQMSFQFTPVTGETLSSGSTSLSLNAEASFLAWYQSSQSQQFGSLFTATIPFNLAGDVKNVTSVADTIQSVSVTLANRQGTSNAVSVNLR